MEIEANCVISSDSFEKYGLNDRCRVSRERVQGFLDRGFMAKGQVETEVRIRTLSDLA
jgi:hypothetical protein